MKKGAFIIISLCVALAMAAPAFVYDTAYAGMSDVTVADDNTFQGEIKKSFWYYTDGVKGESNSIVFDGDSDDSSRILSRTKSEDVGKYGKEIAVEAEITLNISQLAENETFMVGFGNRSAAARLGGANSTTVYFVNSGGALRCGVFKTDGDELRTDIAPSKDFSGNAFGKNIALQVQIASAGGVQVKANGTLICNDQNAGAYFVGYFGFGQSAGSQTKISHCSVKSSSYDTPETPVASTADFSKDEFNINEWHTVMSPGYFAPSTMNVSGGMLNFVNTGQSSICSKHVYSNFEFTFDMPYLLAETEYGEEGNIIKPHSYWWGISFGCPSYEGWAGNMVTNAHAIGFQPNTGYDATAENILTNVSYEQYGSYVDSTQISGKYNLWDPANEGKVFNFKLSVIDGKMILSVKYSTEETWSKIIEKEIGYTPLGYVGILAIGHSAAEGVNLAASGMEKNITVANFSLDNLRIENKDQDARIIEVPFKSNRLNIPEDFAYEDSWNDGDMLSEKLNDGEIAAPKGKEWIWVVVIGAAGVAVLGVAAALIVISAKRREKK